LAVVAVAASYASRVGFEAWVGPGLSTFVTFYPAVMIAALLGGIGPGLLATALTVVIVAIWVMPPTGQLAIAEPVNQLALTLFCCMGLFMSWVAELVRRNQVKAAAFDHTEALQESEKRFRALVQASSDLIYRMGPDWTELRYLIGRDFIADKDAASDTWFQTYIPADEQPRVLAAVNQAICTKSTFELEHRVLRDDGSLGWVFSRAVPIIDADGRIIEWIGSASDITEQKAADERIKILLREVNHRAKNLLSVVQAIASQTAATSNRDDFLKRFFDRLQALAANQDLLVKNKWHRIELADLVRVQLAHFESLKGNRIALEGPPTVITAKAAQCIGMAVHELATNAAKYGALSGSEGTIRIAWTLDQEGAGKDRLCLSWTERGGPEVRPPTRRGFGTTVIERIPRIELAAEVSLDYAPSGVTWHLSCPANNVLEPAGAEVGGEKAPT
jgi:two-component sensor histidine kinase/PAS domain-containing protein